MGQKAKVVFDNNVWISIIFNKTLGREFNRLLESEIIEVFASEEILGELARVLNYPKIISSFEKAEISLEIVLKEISMKVIFVNPKEKINKIEKDPSDNIFLECAVESKAKFIVSGDKHLLELRKFRNIEIITPREFLNIYHK